jgi:hypothetical protein
MANPNTNPLTYDSYVQEMATMAVVSPTDAAFVEIIPQMLNYAELRIQRDLDLLASQTTFSYLLPTATNTINLDADDLYTVQTINVVVNGVPTPVLPTTKEFIQNMYSDPTATGTPQYFAMYGGDYASGGNAYNYILVGPYPDVQYTVNLTGTIRTPSLYKFAGTNTSNTSTTYISAYYPDLLIMASMVYISAYQRNFGRMSDDPAMAQSYEGQYQALVRNSITDENRKKFAGSAWSSMSTPIAATPSR